MSTAAIIGGTAAAGLASSAIGAHAAGKAADAQAAAAEQAAALQHQDAQAALDFQKTQYGNSLKALSPYYGMGTASLNRLGDLMGLPQQQVTFDPNNPNGKPPAPAPNPGNDGFDLASWRDSRAGAGRDAVGPAAIALARGGVVRGPGTSTSDSVPIHASKGEVVVNAAAASLPGVTEGLMRLNMLGDHLMPKMGGNRFAVGGMVGVPGQTGDSITMTGTAAGTGANTQNFGGGPVTDGTLTTTGTGATGSTWQPPNFLGPPVSDGSGGGSTGPTGPPINDGSGQSNGVGGVTGSLTPGSGQQSLGPTGTGTGFLATPWTQEFKPPTAITEQNDPGYQFRLQQGMDALQNSAAARGGLLSGGTAKDITNYGQNYASNEYGNVYNRALNEYLNRYNIFRNNQTDLYNRFAGIAGLGQTSTSELVNAGQNSANNASNILLTSGQQIGNNINNAGAARASGYVGAGNAITGALSGVNNLATLYAIMNQ